VPQLLQKLRMAVPDELMVFGSPCSTVSEVSGNSAHAITGAPELRLQSMQ
jgi:hypothetical protein